MNEKKTAADFPIRLRGERAWRTYLGGRMIDRLHGQEEGEDGHFPEEWIASLVAARNAGREDIEEGVSRVAADPGLTLPELLKSAPELYLGEAHAARHGADMGVLVKLIDAAERLTVQVHPDRRKARELFSSEYGKTECWHILGGRRIDGQEPCVYLGFREGVERARWEELFDRQDIGGMLACLHRFPARPGDTILIEGGIPHAIGAGCFLTEIQEPTDYTVRVERTTPSGFAVDDFLCHQGLGFDRMFDCFHYGGYSAEETRRRWFVGSRQKRREAGGAVTALIGPGQTDFFAMDRIEATGRLELCLPPVFSGLYVLSGRGRLSGTADPERAESIAAGDQFFVPAGTGGIVLEAESGAEPLRLIHFFGPSGAGGGEAGALSIF